MDDTMTQHHLAQRINQRLQLNPATADPLGQCGACQGYTGTGIDRFLTVQRQVIGLLGHQHLGQ